MVEEKNETLLTIDNETLLGKYKEVVFELGSLIQQCEPQTSIGLAEYFDKRMRREILRRMTKSKSQENVQKK